jgi:hypothetical protein
VIQYNGGPLVLENVKFENCQFQLPMPAQLDETLLASSSVSFNSGG